MFELNIATFWMFIFFNTKKNFHDLFKKTSISQYKKYIRLYIPQTL